MTNHAENFWINLYFHLNHFIPKNCSRLVKLISRSIEHRTVGCLIVSTKIYSRFKQNYLISDRF